jgi:hypothetical protein
MREPSVAPLFQFRAKNNEFPREVVGCGVWRVSYKSKQIPIQVLEKGYEYMAHDIGRWPASHLSKIAVEVPFVKRRL